MNRRRLGLVVEGHGEVKAMPILVRRIVECFCPGFGLDLPEPFLLKRGLMTKDAELTRAVDLMARKVGPGEPVLIVLDADTDLGCKLAPDLLSIASKARNDRAVGVVAATREYEAWLIAGLAPLSGCLGVVADLPQVDDAEALPNPKAWLKRHMSTYSETVDQAKLTAAFDLSLARRTYSFDKLERELVRLLDLGNSGEVQPLRKQAGST